MGSKPSEGSEIAHKLKNTCLDYNFPSFEETRKHKEAYPSLCDLNDSVLS